MKSKVCEEPLAGFSDSAEFFGLGEPVGAQTSFWT